MTDPTSEKPLFESVPTFEAYLELVGEHATLKDDIDTLREHVDELQASIPADGDDDTDEDAAPDLTEVHAALDTLTTRVDRHRAEIENVKRVINQIISFLGSGSANTIAPSPQADGHTITPTSTGGL